MEFREHWLAKSLMGLFLLCNAWQDWRKREILSKSLWIFGGIGLVLNMIWGRQAWLGTVGGVLVGGMLLLCSLATQGGIGPGDGLLLCVTGLYLGLGGNLGLLLGALFLCACCSAGLLLARRVNRKTGIPFAPFLLAAYLGGILLL